MSYCCLACGYRICQCGFDSQRVEHSCPPGMDWCEDCKSCHTKELGEEFHDRILEPIVFNDEECSIQAGDVISFESVYGVCPRWWQFWHWFRKPKPQHKLFIVQEPKP